MPDALEKAIADYNAAERALKTARAAYDEYQRRFEAGASTLNLWDHEMPWSAPIKDAVMGTMAVPIPPAEAALRRAKQALIAAARVPAPTEGEV